MVVTGTARSILRESPPLIAEVSLDGPFQPARDADKLTETMRTVFDKLGQTSFDLTEFSLLNPDGLFVPISQLNSIRRELMDKLDTKWQEDLQQSKASLINTMSTKPTVSEPKKVDALRWSLKVDRISFLDALVESDWQDIDELVIDITRDHPRLLRDHLVQWSERIGAERIRLALPALTRRWEESGLKRKIESLRSLGWSKWEVANLSAWDFLQIDPNQPQSSDLDIATDWSIYVINRLAALQLMQMGVSRFTLSPEDGLANMQSLLAEFSENATVIVHQDTPQFLAESCAYANLIGGCPGKANCSFESMEMVSSHGEKATAIDYHCRTIVLNQGPFCLSTRLKSLAKAGAELVRADFVYRNYKPDEVRDRWRLIRAGKKVPGGHAANFDRGIL